jgi:broad specificity phosphatase PhoE
MLIPLLFQLIAAPAPATIPTTVIVVRHAEKLALPANDPGLSPAGVARAAALDSALASAKVTAIIVTPYTRTRSTATVVAQRYGLTPIEMPVRGGVPAHARAVADSARALGGTVLVVGHSNTIGAIVTALGGPTVGDLCDNVYESFFTVILARDHVDTIRSRFGAPNPPSTDGCGTMKP